jgi:hypothetical protein
MPKLPSILDVHSGEAAMGRRWSVGQADVSGIGTAASAQARAANSLARGLGGLGEGVHKYGLKLKAEEEKNARSAGASGFNNSDEANHYAKERFLDATHKYEKDENAWIAGATDDEITDPKSLKKREEVFDGIFKPLWDEQKINMSKGQYYKTDSYLRKLKRGTLTKIEAEHSRRRGNAYANGALEEAKTSDRERILLEPEVAQSILDAKVYATLNNEDIANMEDRKDIVDKLKAITADNYFESKGIDYTRNVLAADEADIAGEPEFVRTLPASQKRALLGRAEDRQRRADAKATVYLGGVTSESTRGVVVEDREQFDESVRVALDSDDVKVRVVAEQAQASQDYLAHIVPLPRAERHKAMEAMRDQRVDPKSGSAPGLSVEHQEYYKQLVKMHLQWEDAATKDLVQFGKNMTTYEVNELDTKTPEALAETFAKRLEDMALVSQKEGRPLALVSTMEAKGFMDRAKAGDYTWMTPIRETLGGNAMVVFRQMTELAPSPFARSFLTMAYTESVMAQAAPPQARPVSQPIEDQRLVGQLEQNAKAEGKKKYDWQIKRTPEVRLERRGAIMKALGAAGLYYSPEEIASLMSQVETSLEARTYRAEAGVEADDVEDIVQQIHGRHERSGVVFGGITATQQGNLLGWGPDTKTPVPPWMVQDYFDDFTGSVTNDFLVKATGRRAVFYKSGAESGETPYRDTTLSAATWRQVGVGVYELYESDGKTPIKQGYGQNFRVDTTTEKFKLAVRDHMPEAMGMTGGTLVRDKYWNKAVDAFSESVDKFSKTVKAGTRQRHPSKGNIKDRPKWEMPETGPSVPGLREGALPGKSSGFQLEDLDVAEWVGKNPRKPHPSRQY